MNSFSTTVRRALDRARHLRTGFGQLTRLPSAARATAAFVLAATVLVAPAPARASAPMPEDDDLAARVQVIIKSVHIWDDRDWGDGDLHLRYWLTCTAKTVSCFGLDSVNVDHYDKAFDAASGETRTIDAVLPGSTERLYTKFSPSVELGYSLYRGHVYGLGFEMREHDDLTENEDMGERRIVLTAENGWAIGTHSLRSSRNGVQGDFTIDFEVRPVSLPDLRPVNITVDNLPNSPKQHVCAPVQNVGTGEAGPFLVSFYADGVALPGGEPVLPRLASADSSVLCIDTQLAAGPHQLRAVVDGPDRVVEFNETNNVIEQTYTAPAQAGSATPEQTSTGKPAATTGAAQADLTVSAIKVNGQVPDGKDDCKDGKNVVAVVVKNGGAAKADAVAVRLAVDGAEVGAQSVASLEPGKEREVRFADVSLKKGTHALTAVADPTKVITEANADNNELKVTVACKGDD